MRIINNIQNKNTATMLTVLIVSLFLSSIYNQSTFIAHGARPDVGFQDGVSDCQTGTSNAINGHGNAGHHSAAYMEAYNRGLASCGSSNSNSNTDQGATGGNSASSNIPIAPQSLQQQVIQQPTFNGNNNTTKTNETALDFAPICNLLQMGLYHSCSELVNSNGDLTVLGDTTVKCIITSTILNVGATVLQIQPNFINNTLTDFSGPTGCGGVVKIDQLNNLLTATGNTKGIVNQLTRFIQ